MSTKDLDPSWTPDLGEDALFAERTWFAGLFVLAVATVTPDNRKIKSFWMGIVSALIICATIYAAAGEKINEISFITYRNYPGGPSAFEPAFFSLPVNAAGNVFFILANWICDAILVWRCLIIYRQSRIPLWIIMIIPCSGYLGSIALGICWAIQVCNPETSPWVSKGVNFTVPYLSLSLALNIFMSTALSLRLLVYRWRMKKLPNIAGGINYLGLVAMIVESAVVYSIFSLCSIVTFLLNHPIQNVFNQLFAEAQVKFRRYYFPLHSGLICALLQIVATLMILYRVASGTAWTSDTAHTLFSGVHLTFAHTKSDTTKGTSTIDVYDKEAVNGAESTHSEIVIQPPA
ncbi:hypothetical protein NLJ89_g2739 [Agrocybe chaxingu]|uniref:Uncharacterized protein n=1 Tax=Agrocybe chaxingu TaxID=84603 RepID=A0A9W8K6Q4_9AGAR|nr:hypothetical protein NLJ89_g2739 [Agrocybe chaxingu]